MIETNNLVFYTHKNFKFKVPDCHTCSTTILLHVWNGTKDLGFTLGLAQVEKLLVALGFLIAHHLDRQK